MKGTVMKLEMIHPGRNSLQAIREAIDRKETIYRSPHVGNVNGNELNLITGVENMGGDLHVELVDTIRGKDSYSQPRVAICGDMRLPLASNKQSGKIVGACHATDEGRQALIDRELISGDTVARTLKDIHLESLRAALPDAIEITPSSKYFAQLGEAAYSAVLEEARVVVNRPLRTVLGSGSISEAGVLDVRTGIYGLGEDPNVGILPPLEGMLAVEIIKPLLESNCSDADIVHIAGPDMIRYTKDAAMMRIVATIARGALIRLGKNTSVTVTYTVPCMKETIESPKFESVIPSATKSQYDLIVAKEAGRVSL